MEKERGFFVPARGWEAHGRGARGAQGGEGTHAAQRRGRAVPLCAPVLAMPVPVSTLLALSTYFRVHTVTPTASLPLASGSLPALASARRSGALGSRLPALSPGALVTLTYCARGMPLRIARRSALARKTASSSIPRETAASPRASPEFDGGVLGSHNPGSLACSLATCEALREPSPHTRTPPTQLRAQASR